jgi:acyl-coenzyme A thioesterase PaaI-like protein
MKRQPNSRLCFVCGVENPIGLKVVFEEEGKQVWAKFTPREEHQGFPGILHGGLTGTLLDEAMGRFLMVGGEERWMLSAKLEVRYRKPIPIGEPLTVMGEVVQDRGRLIETRGEIRLSDGRLAAEARGIYVQIAQEMRERMERELGDWQVWVV